MSLVEESFVYDAAGNVGQIPALLWVSVFPSYKWDNNSCLGKVGEFISPGGELQPQKKRLKDEVNGGGVRNSRELRGAYGLHGNARQPGEEAGLGNRLPQGLKLKVSQRKLPSPRRKAFSETELCTRTGSALCFLPRVIDTENRSTERSRVFSKSLAGQAFLTSDPCSGLYQNAVSLNVGLPECTMRQLKE